MDNRPFNFRILTLRLLPLLCSGLLLSINNTTRVFHITKRRCLNTVRGTLPCRISTQTLVRGRPLRRWHRTRHHLLPLLHLDHLAPQMQAILASLKISDVGTLQHPVSLLSTHVGRVVDFLFLSSPISDKEKTEESKPGANSV